MGICKLEALLVQSQFVFVRLTILASDAELPMTAKLFKRTAQKFDTIAHVSWIPLVKIVGGSLSIRRNVCRDSECALKFPNGLHVEVVTL